MSKYKKGLRALKFERGNKGAGGFKRGINSPGRAVRGNMSKKRQSFGSEFGRGFKREAGGISRGINSEMKSFGRGFGRGVRDGFQMKPFRSARESNNSRDSESTPKRAESSSDLTAVSLRVKAKKLINQYESGELSEDQFEADYHKLYSLTNAKGKHMLDDLVMEM